MAAIAIAILIGAGVTYWWLAVDKNFEECILAQMKGQAASMQSTARKYCARRYRIEQEVSKSEVKLTWSSTLDDTVRIKVESNEFLITKGEFKFARKDCKEASNDDFESSIVGRFDGQVAEPKLPELTAMELRFGGKGCMQTVSLRGTYR